MSHTVCRMNQRLKAGSEPSRDPARLKACPDTNRHHVGVGRFIAALKRCASAVVHTAAQTKPQCGADHRASPEWTAEGGCPHMNLSSCPHMDLFLYANTFYFGL
jgi:hypothetical protein